MTTNEIRNRIAELDNELIYIEFADRMNDEERKRHDELLREHNRLATELYYIEHPQKTIETEEETEFQAWKAEREEQERKKQEGKEEVEKVLALRLYNALKNTNWCGLLTLEKELKQKGWI